MTHDQVLAWAAAAIADGWQHEPTYGHHESELRAATLRRDGWVVMTLTRPETPAALTAWGPDRLQVRPLPERYDMDALTALLGVCLECEQAVPHVQRVGFAGRCCDACLPDARRKYEFRGWAD